VNTPESLDNLRVQSGNRSEYIKANWKQYKMCVNKMEAVENVYHKPEGYQYIYEETESTVKNIGWVSFRGWFAE